MNKWTYIFMPPIFLNYVIELDWNFKYIIKFTNKFKVTVWFDEYQYENTISFESKYIPSHKNVHIAYQIIKSIDKYFIALIGNMDHFIW